MKCCALLRVADTQVRASLPKGKINIFEVGFDDLYEPCCMIRVVAEHGPVDCSHLSMV